MYLIVGGSGFLGRYLIKNILSFTSDNIIATYSSNCPVYNHERLKWAKLDIKNYDEINDLNNILTTDGKGKKLIYLCAFHNPDEVEKNPKYAKQINIDSLNYFISKYNKFNCFYYSSTDVVYGEGSKNYFFKEEEELKPVNLYGRHKVLAEQIVQEKGGNIIRFPFIVDHSMVETKKHFFDRIYEKLQLNQPVEMFYDSYRSSLGFNQCAKYLVNLIEKYIDCNEKIINFASDTPTSKYEIGLKICEEFNFDKNLIKPISINNSNSIFMAKRAKSAVMDNSKMKKLLNIDKIELEINKFN